MKPLEDLFAVFPIIEAKRLILRQLTPEDAPDFFACQSDPEVFRYSGRAEETSLESAKHMLNILFKRHQERTMLSWAIVLKENQHFIGRFQMEEWSDENHRAAVGYLLGKQYWEKGMQPKLYVPSLPLCLSRPRSIGLIPSPGVKILPLPA